MTTIKIDGNYKPENLLLMNLIPDGTLSTVVRERVKMLSETLPIEDKISFLISRYPLFTDTLNMVYHFLDTKDTIKKTTYGEFNANSLKSWIKKNNYINLFDPYSSFPDRFRLRIGTFANTLTSFGHGMTVEKWIDFSMPYALEAARTQEIQHFNLTDPYHMNLDKVRNYFKKYKLAFGLKNVVFDSLGNGFTFINDDRTDFHPLDEYEVDYLLREYNALEEYIASRSTLTAPLS